MFEIAATFAGNLRQGESGLDYTMSSARQPVSRRKPFHRREHPATARCHHTTADILSRTL